MDDIVSEFPRFESGARLITPEEKPPTVQYSVAANKEEELPSHRDSIKKMAARYFKYKDL